MRGDRAGWRRQQYLLPPTVVGSVPATLARVNLALTRGWHVHWNESNMSTGGRRVPSVPLKTVQKLVRDDRFDVGKTRARVLIMEHFDCTEAKAIEFAKDTVLKLQPRHFIRPVVMADGTRADEYGIQVNATGWYLKVWIVRDADADGDRVLVTSCHPAERDLHTLGGVVPAQGD